MISKVKRKAEISRATDKLNQGSEHFLCVWRRIPKKFGATRTKNAVLALRENSTREDIRLRDDTNCIAIAQLSVFLIYFGSTKGL